MQRTLLTGKKEPNVAANELAVRRVDQENTALEQRSITSRPSWSCGAPWPAIRRWRSCSGTARALPARAASSRATPRATGSGSAEAAEHAMSERAGFWPGGCSTGASRPARVGVAVGGLVAGVAIGVNAAGIHVVGSIDGWQRWLAANRGFTSSPGGCCFMPRPPAAGGGCVGACAIASLRPKRSNACGALSRGRAHPRAARRQPTAAQRLND